MFVQFVKAPGVHMRDKKAVCMWPHLKVNYKFLNHKIRDTENKLELCKWQEGKEELNRMSENGKSGQR